MSMLDFDLIERLGIVSFWLNRIIPPLHIIFGTFGNVFNIIIFTRRTLRNNPCAMYFLASSINNCIVIYVIILLRYLETIFDWSPTKRNTVLCKVSTIVQYIPFSLVLWFPVLASIDRFLSSSRNVRLRQLSTLPTARKVIVGAPIFFVAVNLHMPLFYQAVWNGFMFLCIGLPYEYYLFFNVFAPLVTSILPIILLCIFGILMIRNVRSVHNRVASQASNERSELARSNDQQLIRMLLFQVLVTLLISMPYVVTCAYEVFYLTAFRVELSIVQVYIFLFAKSFFSLLYMTNAVIGFYIYTLTGPKFRVEMKRCSQVGVKVVLTAVGLMRWLPLGAQQALDAAPSTAITNVITVRSKRENQVQPTQPNKPRMAWIA